MSANLNLEENCLKENECAQKLEIDINNTESKDDKNSVVTRLWQVVEPRLIYLLIFMTGIVMSVGILLFVLIFWYPSRLNCQCHCSGETGGQDHSTKKYELATDAFAGFPDLNRTPPNEMRIVSRAEWLAQPALATLNHLKTPVPYVIIHHTATENCSSQSTCVFHVRHIQIFHTDSRGFDDIGYNFLVGGDGAVYEGRGWTREGAHTYGWSSKSLGLAFIGTFMKNSAPQVQIAVCKSLIARGVELGYISKDYKLLGARQLVGTESPGISLFKEMKTWDHFAETP